MTEVRTPGQKAYECARAERLSQYTCIYDWAEAGDLERSRWERIAAAVTAAEPKSYGRIMFEEWFGPGEMEDAWTGDRQYREDHERCAAAVIAEFKRREGIK